MNYLSREKEYIAHREKYCHPAYFSIPEYRAVMIERKTLVEKYIQKFKKFYPNSSTISSHKWDMLYEALCRFWYNNYRIVDRKNSTSRSVLASEHEGAVQIMKEEFIFLLNNALDDTEYFTNFYNYVAEINDCEEIWEKMIKYFSLSKLNNSPYNSEINEQKLGEQKLFKLFNDAQEIIAKSNLEEKYGAFAILMKFFTN